MHWSNDKILYKDVHYFTGPLYPILLRIFALLFEPQAAAVSVGVFVVLAFLLSAIAMLNSYTRAIASDYRKDSFWALLSIVGFVTLIVSRYSSVYLTVADYHTLSLSIYCLAVNKVVANYYTGLPRVFWVDKVSNFLSLVPYSFLGALLLLNRFHEGVLFVISTFAFLLLSSREKFYISFLKIAKFLMGTVIYAVLLYAIASIFFGLPDLSYAFKYILFIAPEAKGAHENGYLLKIFITYLMGFVPTFGSLSLIFAALIFFRAIIFSLKNDAFANDVLTIATYIFSIYLFIYLLRRNGEASYLISMNNLMICAIAILYYYIYVRRRDLLLSFDYSILFALSLVGSHVASTSGYYNESFILFLLPSLLYNLSLVFHRVKISRSVSTLIVTAFLGVGASIFVYKFNTPRQWWNSSEPSVFDGRELGFGDGYKEKYPDLKTIPAYPSSELLKMSQKFCEKINSKTGEPIKILSYPLSYFESACETKNLFSSVSSHYVMWLDVSLLQMLKDLSTEIASKKIIPDYVFMQINPLAIEESSRQYWPHAAIEDWPHYEFQDFLYEYSEKSYKRLYVSYLKMGKVVVDSQDIILLEEFRRKGCFHMNLFLTSKICASYMTDKFGTRDLTMLVLYEKPSK